MKNQYEVTLDIEPLEGQPFSLNRGDSEFDQRITFTVQKDIRLDPNRAEIRIYNLNQEHEQALAFRYDINQVQYGGKVTLHAGYRGGAKQIFSGDIVRAYTSPSGGDRVTYIQGMHLIQNMAGGVVDRTFPKDTKQENILEYILGQFSNVGLSKDQKAAAKSALNGLELDNSETLSGSAVVALKSFSDRFQDKVKIFFDENGPQILGPGESNGDIPVEVSKETGLMGSPSITDIGATVRIRLNPGLRNGTPIEVDSEVTQSLLNAQVGGDQVKKVGRYIAEKITHLGDNYPGGEWTTEIVGIYEGGAL
jgi:hypothetical protein